MAKPLVSDELWAVVEPLLPAPKPRRFRYPGRKPIDDRKALTGIRFVLKSGIPWEMLPQEMGCGSGMTPYQVRGRLCWRRLQEWQAAGVWPKLHETLLSRLHGADRLDWSRACVDSAPDLYPMSAGGGRRGKKPAPIPRTGASPGASITCSLTPTERRCRPS